MCSSGNRRAALLPPFHWSHSGLCRSGEVTHDRQVNISELSASLPSGARRMCAGSQWFCFRRSRKMSRKTIHTAAMAVAGTLLLGAIPAMAQQAEGRNEIGVFAGALFGNDLTDEPVSGSVPALDDDFVAGLRYAYNFTPNFALEGSFGINPNKVKGAVGGKVDIDVYTADINAVWNFRNGSRLIPYVSAGVGYAFADLDRPLAGTVGGNAVTIDDDGGVTLNAGGGLKYSLTDRVLVRLDARYRFIDKLVDQFEESLHGGEVTLGLGWRF